ncbi:MAG: hypothetical protein R2769_17040 [Saprospiraceae bacterium]
MNLELENGSDYMLLFVVMNLDKELNQDIIREIAKTLRSDYSFHAMCRMR